MENNTLNNLYDKSENYYAGLRSEMLPFFPAGSQKVLDVGCGEGWFGKSIKDKHQSEVWGVDISSKSIEIAKKNIDKAFCINISENHSDIPDHYFDSIFFNDVLEHLIDPYTLLKDIKCKLKDDGVVVASIPNMRHFRVLHKLLFKKDFEYEESGIMDKTHLRFFTQKSMIRMFQEAGYEILKVTPINKTKSLRPVIMKILTFGLIGNDISYLQFVITAKKK